MAIPDRIVKRLAQPVDAASLVYFRIILGLTVTWEMCRYWVSAWADRYWVEPSFLFTYPPFEGWLEPMGSLGMNTLLVLIGVAGFGMAAGYRYRLSSALAFAGLTYLFLLDQATYLNHFYLLCVLTFIAIWLPVAGCFSLDARQGRGAQASTVPTWALWLVLFQLAVPYVGGGIAKLNPDWLAGEPLRAWLSERTHFPLVGTWFTQEWVVKLMAGGGLLLDLCGPFFLLHKRTRRWAYLVFLVFHTFNSRLFRIGIFPWFMIAATAVFFAPDWPRRVWRDIKGEHARGIAALLGGFTFGFALSSSFPQTDSPTQAMLGALGWSVFAWHLIRWDVIESEIAYQKPAPPKAAATLRTPTLLALGVWATLQVVVPLRHFAIPGNVHWTEEGHNYSWHMKLRDKNSRARFFLKVGDSPRIRLDLDDYLTKRQQRKMRTRPTLIVQFAHHLADEWEARRGVRPTVTAQVKCSLNSRPRQLLIDPKVDLAALPWPLDGESEFIVPLTTPLREAQE